MELFISEGCAYDDIDSSQYTDNVSHSLLWDESLRRNVIKMKLTDIEMNKLKSESLVPGKDHNVDYASILFSLKIMVYN